MLYEVITKRDVALYKTHFGAHCGFRVGYGATEVKYITTLGDAQDDMQPADPNQEANSYDDTEPFGEFSEYEELRGVPPPNKTERDILAEEAGNRERRKADKGGEYRNVEKDW